MTTPADVVSLGRLVERADVIVSGLGLYNTHHVLLQESAHVVEVESSGKWQTVEPRGTMHCAFRREKATRYQRVLTYAGVVPSTGKLDYAAVRAFSDYRVDLQHVQAAVSAAFRGNLGTCAGSGTEYPVYTAAESTYQLTSQPVWSEPADFRLLPLERDTNGTALSEEQAAALQLACPVVCRQKLLDGRSPKGVHFGDVGMPVVKCKSYTPSYDAGLFARRGARPTATGGRTLQRILARGKVTSAAPPCDMCGLSPWPARRLGVTAVPWGDAAASASDQILGELAQLPSNSTHVEYVSKLAAKARKSVAGAWTSLARRLPIPYADGVT